MPADCTFATLMPPTLYMMKQCVGSDGRPGSENAGAISSETASTWCGQRGRCTCAKSGLDTRGYNATDSASVIPCKHSASPCGHLPLSDAAERGCRLGHRCL